LTQQRPYLNGKSKRITNGRRADQRHPRAPRQKNHGVREETVDRAKEEGTTEEWIEKKKSIMTTFRACL